MNTFVRECNNFGNFVRRLFTGRGRIVEASGSKYEGQWKRGKQHGQGIYTWPNGSTYDGNWDSGKQHGQGTCTLASGDKYEGQWKRGKQHGQGIYTWPNGSTYDGQWKNHSIYITTDKLKEDNQHPTLVFRSTKLSSEKLPLLYEKDKFLPNGKEIDVKVVGNPQEFLTELQSYFDQYKNTHDKTL